MGFQFAFSQVQPLKGTWNPFFMILSLFMAVNGAFTAIQFIETLVQKKETSASHTSKKVSALFSIFACAWCIGVNCVWVMHFLAMSAVMFSMKPMRYDIPTTVLSLLYIFLGALLALCLLTFHKHSIVYKIRDRLAARDSAVMPITSSSHKAAGSEENVTDLHGSLDALRNELYGLATDLLAFLSPRLAVGSIFVGTGVVLMHFSGMQAMRCDDVDTIVNPIMAGLALPIAWIGAAVILFFLYHMHGFKRRFVASLIIGVAVNLVHYFGFFAGTFYAVPATLTNSSLAVGAEVACVIVSLLSSVARFVFMGMIAANTD